ncbi:MAG: hypothetical protein A2V98_24450 [Planctomycetes bacterium RBG_16_64_12]|nr:MAG: hypothetical protein A2V98_24450 [Planctomycetes bacterium RBG_16_64_12]
MTSLEQVAANREASGVDHVTVDEFARQVPEVLWQLSDALKDGSYRPPAIRRVYIPMPASSEKRPLGIPTVQWRSPPLQWLANTSLRKDDATLNFYRSA